MNRNFLLPLILIFLGIPNISAQEFDKKLIFVLPEEPLSSINAELLIRFGDVEEINNFLLAKNYEDGIRDSRFLEQIRQNQAGPILYEYYVTQQVFWVKEITGKTPHVSTVYSGEDIASEEIKDRSEELRRRTKKIMEDQKVDPGKDFVIFVSPRTLFSYYDDLGDQTYTLLSLTLINKYTLAHELEHAGYSDGKFYCDTDDYKHWLEEDQLNLELRGEGCPNEYDPLGCCRDNPLWSEGGIFSEESFNREAYEDHLEKNNIGQDCLPRSVYEKGMECEDCPEKQCLNQDYFKGLAGEYTCLGNPCETGDPGHPYCRDVMGGLTIDEDTKKCFEGGVKLAKIMQQGGGDGYYEN